MTKLFGTDGIRAKAGEYPLDYTSIHTLGSALVSLLKEKGYPPQIMIGRDPRESGEWIEEALFHGITHSKGEAASLGIIPTSAVAYLTAKYSYSAGIAISASHNHYEDNGIKVFSAKGTKIPSTWEVQLERAIHTQQRQVKKIRRAVKPSHSLPQDYIDCLKERFSYKSLPRKITVVLDCANGASTLFAPRVFYDLGFEVKAINITPNGKNINLNCGSLHPEKLAESVLSYRADFGAAYDGDADRAIMVDERGNILNGDHTLYILSLLYKKKKLLKSDTIVATTMSNIGLEHALKKIGLKLIRTPVGDKHVLDRMKKIGSNLGGEQSGHTILYDELQTGDGILTSLKVLDALITLEKPLSKLAEGLENYPQVLVNVRVRKKDDFDKHPDIINTIREIQTKLGSSGRVLVRYSGTEPLVRVMVEGRTNSLVKRHADRLIKVIDKHLGEN